MGDVIFADKTRLLDVAAQLKRSAHAALELGYELCAAVPVAGQQTHGTTFRALKVTTQAAAPGAESVVYDSLVDSCDCSIRHAGLNFSHLKRDIDSYKFFLLSPLLQLSQRSA